MEYIIQKCKSYELKVRLSDQIARDKSIIYDLSIIVPCYNVQQYITECIESIIRQETSYTYELIVVNDGSEDKTYDLLEQLQKLYSFRLIHQENQGSGSARNRGIAIAAGTYYMFVDSDDRLKPGYIQRMLDATNHFRVDIVGSGYEFLVRDKTYTAKYYNKSNFYVDLEKNPESIRKLEGFPIFKIFKSQLFKDIDFPEGVVFEDTIVRMTLLRRAKTYQHIGISGYQYRKHMTSVTYRASRGDLGLDAIYVMYHLSRLNALLAVNQDKEAFGILLLQLSKYLYPRVKHLSLLIQEQVLYAAKHLLLQFMPVNPHDINADNQLILYAVLNQDYRLWKQISKLVN
jgi:glycosyltransferase involved in cell wall biosynthesis